MKFRGSSPNTQLCRLRCGTCIFFFKKKRFLVNTQLQKFKKLKLNQIFDNRKSRIFGTIFEQLGFPLDLDFKTAKIHHNLKQSFLFHWRMFVSCNATAMLEIFDLRLIKFHFRAIQ